MGAALEGRSLVADHAAGEADQDQREGDPPWSLHYLPTRQDRSIPCSAFVDPGLDRGSAGTTKVG